MGIGEFAIPGVDVDEAASVGGTGVGGTAVDSKMRVPVGPIKVDTGVAVMEIERGVAAVAVSTKVTLR